MPFAHVQQNVSGYGNSAAPQTLAFPADVTAGNLLVVGVATYNPGVTVAVTDSQGNTYTQAVGYATSTEAGGVRASQWYAIAGSTGPNTVTVSPSASAYSAIHLLERSGVDTADPFNAGSTGTGTGTAADCGSVPVAQADSLVVVLVADNAGGSRTWTAGTGFDLRTQQPNGSSFVASATEDDLSVGAAVNGTITLSTSAAWAAIGASYNPATGGGVSGSLAATLSAATLSAAGTVAVTGQTAAQLADLTAAGTGTVAVAGSAAITLGDVTATAAGAVAITGDLAAQLADATLAATGSTADGLTGALAVTLADATAAATGTVAVSGSAAVSLADATCEAAGTVVVQGSATAGLESATLSAAGQVAIAGLLAGMLDALTCAGTATAGGAAEPGFPLGTFRTTAPRAFRTKPARAFRTTNPRVFRGS